MKNGNRSSREKSFDERFPHLSPEDDLLKIVALVEKLAQRLDESDQRLDKWTEAIIRQTELGSQQNQMIIDQNTVLQATAKNNAELGSALLESKQDYAQLKVELSEVRNIIAALVRASDNSANSNQNLTASILERVNSLSLPEWSQMQSDIDLIRLGTTTLQLHASNQTDRLQSHLDQKIDAVQATANTISTTISNLKSKPQKSGTSKGSKWLAFSLIVLAAVTASGFWMADQAGQRLDRGIVQLNGNINNVLIRLQRLENR